MIPEPLLIAIQLVRGVRAKGPVGRFAKEVLPLLERAAEQLEDGQPVRRKLGRGDGAIEYVVEKTAQGEVLTERRSGGTSQPLRCPKVVYDAAIRMLATTTKPLSMDEILSGIETVMGVRPAEFQMRVALRLWLHADPALISRLRARYRLADSTGFISKATRLWSSLRAG
jgi:hypothetical protein